jgi:hypothetical protein
VSQFSKEDTVRILTNLDIMGAAHIPDERRAWAHLIAMGLLQKVIPDPVKLSRERWLTLAASIYDKTYGALANGEGPTT